MPDETTATFFVAIAIVRNDGRFLLVHERKFGESWYFPAGRVDPGESIPDAAVRETREESGIAVELDGVYRVEHKSIGAYTRVRVFFSAHPCGETKPKDVADEHTLGAAWLTRDEIARLPLRDPEVLEIIDWVLAGATMCPLSVLVSSP
jgi:phosphatase NudJ